MKINADYTSLTPQSPDGTVARDDRLTNYSPGFKRALLVEALSLHLALHEHARRRQVRRRGDGEGLAQGELRERHQPPPLARAFLPIVVHGGGPEITHTLEKLGRSQSEFVDGVRVTGREDVKVVEMVLTGKINTELVSLLEPDERARGRASRARTRASSARASSWARAGATSGWWAR